MTLTVCYSPYSFAQSVLSKRIGLLISEQRAYKSCFACLVYTEYMCMCCVDVYVGILIVVAVGVALGVFLGGTMLLLASMLMKR